MADEYSFLARYPDPDGTGPLPAEESRMARLLYDNPGTLPTDLPDVLDFDPVPLCKIGFVLFDEDEFSSIFRENRGDEMTEDQDHQCDGRITTFGTAILPTAPDVQVSNPPTEAEEEHWLNRFATPFLINRYNGTLIRGE
jgi:hypothetical protein